MWILQNIKGLVEIWISNWFSKFKLSEIFKSCPFYYQTKMVVWFMTRAAMRPLLLRKASNLASARMRSFFIYIDILFWLISRRPSFIWTDRVWSRPSFISSTKFYLDRPSFISTEFYLVDQVSSGPTEFYLDRISSRRPSFIWTDRVSSRPSYISTNFYLVYQTLFYFILTDRVPYRLSFIWTDRVSSRPIYISS